MERFSIRNKRPSELLGGVYIFDVVDMKTNYPIYTGTLDECEKFIQLKIAFDNL